MAPLAPSADAAFPGRNGQIAFEQACFCMANEAFIGSVLPSGARDRPLVDLNRGFGSSRRAMSPAYSASGGQLAFDAEEDPGPSRLDGLWTKALRRGSRARHLRRTNRRDGAPGWSPGGRRLVYVSEHRRGPNIRVYRRGRSHRLTWGLEPTWSLRGRIAFTRARGSSPNGRELSAIYVMRPDGSGIRRVAAGSGPNWSPHGSWLVFTRRDSRIGLVRPDGSDERVLTREPPGSPGDEREIEHFDPAFSPDGNYVVFTRRDTFYEEWTLVLLRLSDGQLRTIKRVGGAESTIENADWQPLRSRR
jgi:Tol biopolymer transport system component